MSGDDIEHRMSAVEDDVDTLKHAVFGFGDGTGMLAEMRAMRTEFAAFRTEITGEFASFRNVLVATVIGIPTVVAAGVVVLERLTQ